MIDTNPVGRSVSVGASSAAEPATARSAMAAVPVRVQLRRAAWMTLFPTTVGLVYAAIATQAAPRPLGAGLIVVAAAAAAFFVLLAATSLVGSRWGGPRFALRTRTVCPECRREIAIIATRCPECRAQVPVGREAMPTFAYTAILYGLFQLTLLFTIGNR